MLLRVSHYNDGSRVSRGQNLPPPSRARLAEYPSGARGLTKDSAGQVTWRAWCPVHSGLTSVGNGTGASAGGHVADVCCSPRPARLTWPAMRPGVAACRAGCMIMYAMYRRVTVSRPMEVQNERVAGFLPQCQRCHADTCEVEVTSKTKL